jgi:hypothetical protein
LKDASSVAVEVRPVKSAALFFCRSARASAAERAGEPRTWERRNSEEARMVILALRASKEGAGSESKSITKRA